MRRARLTRGRALEVFKQHRTRRGFAKGTIALEQRLLNAALSEIDRRSLARVTRRDLRAYLARRARRVRATTLSRELCVLSTFFRFLTAEGLITSDPTLRLTTRPGTPRPPLLLSRVAVTSLLRAASQVTGGKRSLRVRRARALRDRALVEVLYGLGLRASEAAAMRLGDLDLSTGELLVRRVKRGKPRRLPLPTSALPHLEVYSREGRQHLVCGGEGGDRFLLTERGTPLTGSKVFTTIKAVAKRAGVRAHPHAFRRALATHLVQEGASLLLVRELLGHVRLDTTQRYVLVERDDLRKAVDKLDQYRHGGAVGSRAKTPTVQRR